MKGESANLVRLRHILDACTEIGNYIKDTEFPEFKENSMMKLACVKQLEIIGEASNHLSFEFKQQFAEIKWKQIIAMRNVLVHEYFGIDSRIVWDILKEDLPKFKNQIEQILDQHI
jgi:uncharacterized protein with HEPN domain